MTASLSWGPHTTPQRETLPPSITVQDDNTLTAIRKVEFALTFHLYATLEKFEYCLHDTCGVKILQKKFE